MANCLAGCKDDLRKKTKYFRSKGEKVPHTGAILIGNDGASETLCGHKIRSCEETGFRAAFFRFDSDADEQASQQDRGSH